MAVYERTYRSYEGPVTPEKTRFLVLPRYSYKQVFRSKLFVALLVVFALWPFGLSLWIYLPHNLDFLESMGLEISDLGGAFNFDAQWFFNWFWAPFVFVAWLVAVIVGPALISADLRNNGLPLYLARPFSRAEYILGKSMVLIVLLSMVTWVPGMFLFLFQSYMAGWGWFKDNYRIGIAMLVASAIWVLILCLVSLALSAYLKWRPVAAAALVIIFFGGAMMAGFVNLVFTTTWGSLLNTLDMMRVAAAGLFGVSGPADVPAWAAWASLLGFCAVCLLLLSRKVRAYEVVRS